MAEPMYRRIADDLRGQIESGTLGHGEQLATEIELMERYGASRNTVRDAVKLLITRGLVETRPGRGTFVVAKVTPFVTTLTGDPQSSVEGLVYRAEVEEAGRTPFTSDPRVEIQHARAWIANALLVEAGTEVVSRHQRRFIDGTPWSMQTSIYPMALVERGATRLVQATNISEGTVAYLATCGFKQVSYQDLISVRTPDENETGFFKLPADGRTPVFDIARVAFDEESAPIRLTVTVYPADRNQFLVNVGNKVPTRTRRD